MAKLSVHDEAPASPIEVWLSRANLEIRCTIVHEDESTEAVEVDSLSMRGAQREITGWLISRGYKPVGRWAGEWASGAAQESSRSFRVERNDDGE